MSRVKIFVNEKLSKRIEENVQREVGHTIGFLLGVRESGNVHIVGAVASKDKDPKRLVEEYLNAEISIPSGLIICGIFVKTQQASFRTIVEQLCKIIFPEDLKKKFPKDGMVLYAVEMEANNPSVFYWYNLESQTAETAQPVTTTQCFLNSCIMFRLQMSLELCFECDEDAVKQKQNLLAEFNCFKDKLLSSSSIFRLKNTNILVTSTGNSLGTLPYDTDSSSAREVLALVGNEEYEKLRKKKGSDFSQVVIDVEYLQQMTGAPAAAHTVSCAPIIHHKHKQFKYATLSLPIDAVCYIHEAEPLNVWPIRITESLLRQIMAMFKCILSYQGKDMCLPKPFHFRPGPIEHLLTVIYPDNLGGDELEEERKKIHQKYLLPMDRPYVRKLNSFRFPSSAEGILLNTHIGLGPSGVTGGSDHLVDGTYGYHHYMQDHMNDDGWGCAYRSLQTLVSWFRYQGYTEKPVPSHRDIQQTLVDIGDKPAKFVGSKQWIGSMEVSFVINTLLGIESKTLYVSAGADLANKGRELASHFDVHGTPIMIGGGVLAHTILGVSFNDQTGELKFLILDPHYKGGEDLKEIQGKGWCGWKGTDFWDQIAYYNLCMPQRPSMI